MRMTHEYLKPTAVIGTNAWGGKPDQVKDLAEAVDVRLTSGEVKRLEEAADKAGIRIMGADIFRPFVLKERK